MTDSKESSRYERFRLLLVSEAKCEEVGHAYFIAEKFYPEKTGDEICQVVKEALLELLDEDLILFYRADEDTGYHLEQSEVEPRGREEIVAVLEQCSWVDPPDQILFFLETERGVAYLASLPPGAVPRLAEML
jgi:hypothetical protein